MLPKKPIIIIQVHLAMFVKLTKVGSICLRAAIAICDFVTITAYPKNIIVRIYRR